jgi:phenylalanine-4-hydroxylase
MQTYDDVRKNLPDHLQQYIVDQDYSRYTPLDQATWRFSLRQLKHFLADNAHEAYISGLEKTGISVNEIPHIEVMCEKLQKFGWCALPVSGFIPPAAFMELQSLGVLPIASDMRSVDHILYTPAPDIVHEAAGHAPILVDEKFAQYLVSYAQVAKKAIISSEDLAQYEAIRDLSDIKEAPHSTPEMIRAAESALVRVNESISHVSEAALLGRMNWWTAEYGLIGDLESPKIFGAGLLSSVGEARACLSKKVKKIPLSVDCVSTSYDITEQQPQLFVARSFDDLLRVLKELEETLSFRRGGTTGLERIRKAKTVNTVELNSGLQISGKLVEFLVDKNDQPLFLRFTGPCQLSEDSQELEEQGTKAHAQGFSSPIGLLKNQSQCLSEWSDKKLSQENILVDQTVTLEFASGVMVRGELRKKTFAKSGKLLVLTFDNCTMTYGGKTLYQPDWGLFDMAVGSSIPSVFGGPADQKKYGLRENFNKKVIPRREYSSEETLKHTLYARIRDLREENFSLTTEKVQDVFEKLTHHFPNEWLAFLELLELSFQHPSLKDFSIACREKLDKIKQTFPEKSEYIRLGVEIANKVV